MSPGLVGASEKGEWRPGGAFFCLQEMSHVCILVFKALHAYVTSDMCVHTHIPQRAHTALTHPTQTYIYTHTHITHAAHAYHIHMHA